MRVTPRKAKRRRSSSTPAERPSAARSRLRNGIRSRPGCSIAARRCSGSNRTTPSRPPASPGHLHMSNRLSLTPFRAGHAGHPKMNVPHVPPKNRWQRDINVPHVPPLSQAMSRPHCPKMEARMPTLDGFDTGYRSPDWDEREPWARRLDYHDMAIDIAAGEMRDVLWKTACSMRDGPEHVHDHVRNTLAALLRYVCSVN